MGFWRRAGGEAKGFLGEVMSWVMALLILFPPLALIYEDWHESLLVRFLAWFGTVVVLLAIWIAVYMKFGSD